MIRNQTAILDVGFLAEMFPTNQDINRCLGSFAKLERHLRQPIILTGSIAIGWHLLSNGIQGEKKPLNDIDVVVENLDCIRTSITQDFLINHFHPQRSRGNILIQLVDAEHRVRIDGFTSKSETLTQRLAEITVGELSCRAVSSEDVLAKLLSVIHPVTNGEVVDPKYVAHFDLLSRVANSKVAKRVWQDYRKESQLTDFDEAKAAVYRSIEANPELLKAEEYGHDVNLMCQWCCESELFPIADRNQVYDILGYI